MKKMISLLGFSILLIACDSSEYPTVGGKVDGLIGTIVLQNNKSQELIIKKDGLFAFPNLFYSPYNVAIVDEPVNQTCFITNNSGDVIDQDITDANVNCFTDILRFTPLTATTLTVASNATAIVQYIVTNESMRGFSSLSMSRVTGISQLGTGLGICPKPFALSENASCVLSISIKGSQLTGNVSGGPEICQSNESLCFEPNQDDQLDITLN